MAGRAGQDRKRDFVILRLPAPPLLLLLLSVCDDVADVLVVYVASNIWGEGGPHVLDLRGKRRECFKQPTRDLGGSRSLFELQHHVSSDLTHSGLQDEFGSGGFGAAWNQY